MFSVAKHLFPYISFFPCCISSVSSVSLNLQFLYPYFTCEGHFILSNLLISSFFMDSISGCSNIFCFWHKSWPFLTRIPALLYCLIGQYTQHVLLKKVFSYPHSEKIHNFLLLNIPSWFCFVYSLFNIFWFLIGLISYVFSLNIL